MKIRDEAQVSDEQKIGLKNLQPAIQSYCQKLGLKASFEELLWYNAGDVYILKMNIAGKIKRIEISEADLEDCAFSGVGFVLKLLATKIAPQLASLPDASL